MRFLDDVPDAELQAMALDGETMRLGMRWLQLDRLPGSAERAASLATHLHPAHIVSGMAAAWVHEAAALPRSIELLCMRHQRADAPKGPGWRVSTVRISLADVDLLGGVRVTTRARTAIDLLTAERWGADEADAVRRLEGAGSAVRWRAERMTTRAGELAVARLDGLPAHAAEASRAAAVRRAATRR